MEEVNAKEATLLFSKLRTGSTATLPAGCHKRPSKEVYRAFNQPLKEAFQGGFQSL